MQITLIEYVGRYSNHVDWTKKRESNAEALLIKVNALLGRMFSDVQLPKNPKTKSNVSGSTLGGFRPQNCPQGSMLSSHKEGRGIDIYDPDEQLDDVITDELLEEFGLYREHPSATIGWCHLTTRPPKSGNRTFLP